VRAAQLREQTPPQPLGARRCAELLAELTGLDITGDDLLTLVSLGHVAEVDYFKEWALYDVAAVRRLGTTEDPRLSMPSGTQPVCRGAVQVKVFGVPGSVFIGVSDELFQNPAGPLYFFAVARRHRCGSAGWCLLVQLADRGER
jgi:hypothetical protein